jgi:putative nucleotidyltransferase with HDIG domain
MINFKKAKKRFEKFINDNFDIGDEKVSHKVIHTYAVIDMAEYIARDLNLDEENIELAKMIALLHDIGRFEQAKEFNNFRDYETLDHAQLGVKILFDNNLIREFIVEDKYDEVIKISILNHNKYKLDESDMSDIEKLHSKLLRDADKTDSFRVKSIDDVYTMANITQEDIETSLISDNIYNDFMSKRTIVSKERKTAVDIWVSYIAFIFDYNFNSGLKYIKDKNYINVLIDRFSYKEKDTKEKMESIRNFAIDFINERTNTNK